MKHLKIYMVVILSLLLTVSAFAQQTEKTLVKSFNLKGKQEVLLNLEGNVDVQEWNNDIMRVQMTISLENGTNSMLKSLVQARRYNLTSKVEGDELVILAPALERQVKIRGVELKEKISYTVYAPSNITVKLADQSTASVNNNKKNSSAL